MGDINESVDKNEGRGYIIHEGAIQELTGMTKISTKRTLKTRTRRPLGQKVVQTKVTGIENDGTLSVDHSETARFNRIVDKYEETGIMDTFDLQIINEDKAANIGRRVVRYYECLLKGDVSLNELEDNSDDALTVDIPFTFRSKKILEDYRK